MKKGMITDKYNELPCESKISFLKSIHVAEVHAAKSEAREEQSKILKVDLKTK